jgi:RNA polymerase sigma factor (TIGR02999 family)
MTDVGESVTEWLRLWNEGDQQGIERATALVYRDLRRLAAYHLDRESHADTLQPTALVHEAYLRVSAIRNIDWKGRAHFLSIITATMRRILVDHARARAAAKRDNCGFGAEEAGRENTQLDILVVDQALERLAVSYPRCARVVELRFFGDMEYHEIAHLMDISLATVERDWRFARAWLQKKMTDSDGR